MCGLLQRIVLCRFKLADVLNLAGTASPNIRQICHSKGHQSMELWEAMGIDLDSS